MVNTAPATFAYAVPPILLPGLMFVPAAMTLAVVSTVNALLARRIWLSMLLVATVVIAAGVLTVTVIVLTN